MQKRGQDEPCPKQTTNFEEIPKVDHKLSKTFHFIKISYALAEL